MPAIIATASLASPPMPFLLNDMSDAIGQMIVVPDDRWDDVIKMLRIHECQVHEIQFIETDQGPFIYLVACDLKDGIFEFRSQEK